MKYRVCLAVIALLVTAFIANEAAAQRRGGFGRPGGRGQPGQNSAMMEQMRAIATFPIDRIWHVLSIRMDMSEEQVLRLRGVVKEASSQKYALVEQAEKSEDWNWLREQLEANQKRFSESLKTLLSSEEMKTFEKLAEEAARMAPGGFSRFRR